MMEVTTPCLINVVYVGDSITYGQYVDPKLRWTSLITDRLNQTYLDTPVHIFSVNRSNPGDTSRMALERFPADVQRANPDVVFIDFGMNDCNCWSTDHGLPRVSEAGFRANLIEMITRSYHFGAKQVILVTKTRSLKNKVMLSGEKYESANARYCEIIREVAAETDVIFYDIRKRFDPLSFDELEKFLLPFPDHIHLSLEGHRFYADLIWQTIDKAIREAIQKKVERGDLI